MTLLATMPVAPRPVLATCTGRGAIFAELDEWQICPAQRTFTHVAAIAFKRPILPISGSVVNGFIVRATTLSVSSGFIRIVGEQCNLVPLGVT